MKVYICRAGSSVISMRHVFILSLISASFINADNSPSKKSLSTNLMRRDPLGVANSLRAGVYESSYLKNIILKPRESYHMERKMFHFLAIYAIAVAFSVASIPKHFIRAILALDFAIVIGEIVRLNSQRFNEVIVRVVGPFMRAHEVQKFCGVMYCLCGIGITAALFPKNMALLGMVQLAVGDPLAALFGHAFRSIRWARIGTNKSIIGTLASTLALTFVNLIILTKATWDFGKPDVSSIFITAFCIGIIASTAELLVPTPQVSLKHRSFPLALDDNFVIPLLGAAGVRLVFTCMQLSGCTLAPMLFW